ncbi:SEC14 cytosolic factor family protein / phosphoglyceride transfer family protein [Zea mays]|uniref:SEC14 cytosolic factor family protein / phosphoglyceride transfer family protein n=1 Tax=Zea mays TaxID=4577 RepID=A0A1D6M894_MAIZE|nr:SEC14 cytosolic factor family protein / phosphoglyceride transfer family protein [Zea mays]
MCSHHATAALNCSPHRARAAIHASPPHPSIHGGRRNPSLPHRARSLGSARPRLLLATPSSSSFPCHHLFPSHDVPHGFTTANEPRLHRRLLGPAGSRSPTRSHPLRTLSSSSFVAAGTSFEKRSIDLVDHGRYGAAHPRAPGMATRSAAASKREGRRSQQQLDPVGDEERAGVRAPTTRLRPDLPSRVPGWGRRWRCHGANTVGGSHNRSRWTDTIIRQSEQMDRHN